MVMAERVLVVDDDPTVAEVVVLYLERAGYVVDCVRDGAAAIALVEAEPPSLVVLDLMLPGMDGLEVCRRLRTLGSVPVVMLTARGDEEDRVIGLELGADDYVSKPFSPRELTARVRAVLRRVEHGDDETVATTLDFGDLVIDVPAREVRRVRGPGESDRSRVRPAGPPRDPSPSGVSARRAPRTGVGLHLR